MNTLLTRDQFRSAVFERDGGTCVFCDRPAIDAHHIMERRLWPDGGYYVDNGASVCEEHHLACERTTISPEQVREACSIEKAVLPPHLYADEEYDKWGNIQLNPNERLPGELFFDDSVQKVLREGHWLDRFTHIVKYPRTYHLPWSPGLHKDDRMMPNTLAFEGQEVVMTEKVDGENTTLYNDYSHARSVDSVYDESRTWVKNFWSSFAHDIPEGWRICGENMFALHSIEYNDLPSYFLGFSIWNERNVCLSWKETLEWFELLGITPVPVIWQGIYNEEVIRTLGEARSWADHEGYVVRRTDSFPLMKFRSYVGKYVREGHVNTTQHWRHRKLRQNKLQGNP